MIVHHPFIFALGPLTLTGFGLAMLAAFWIAQIVTSRELARRGHDPAPVGDVLLAALLGTVVGAKLYYVLVITHDWRDVFSRGGFVFWGGFLGAVAACAWVLRRKRLSFTRFSDVAGIAIAAGYAVGRTGCWAIGDDYGRPWASRWAVQFPEGAPPSTAAIMARTFHVPLAPGTSPDTVLAVYPTQLYEVGLGFLMFLVLWRLRDHEHAEGWLFGLYLVLAGLERFVIEFLRAKDDRFLPLGLSTAQGIALALAVGGAMWMATRWRASAARPGIHAVARAA